jgi:uncharacterized protein YggE
MDNNFWVTKSFKNLVYAISGLLVCFLVFGVILKINDVVKAFTNPLYPNKTIGATGQGKVMALPNAAYLSFSYSSFGADEQKVKDDAEKVISTFKKLLVNKGVKEDSIITSQYFSGKQPYSTPEQAYTFNETFSAELIGTDIQSQLKEIATEALKNNMVATGINNIGCLTYENLTEETKPALKEALENATKSAKNLAETSGFKLGKLVNISDTTAYPYSQLVNNSSMQTYYYPNNCNGLVITPNISVQPQELTTTVSAAFEIK